MFTRPTGTVSIADLIKKELNVKDTDIFNISGMSFNTICIHFNGKYIDFPIDTETDMDDEIDIHDEYMFDQLSH